MKRYLAFLLFISMFSSCMTNKRLEIKVAKAYQRKMPKVDLKPSEQINVNANGLKFEKGFGTAKKIKSYCLPLIFYWNITQHKSFQMNDSIALSFFNSRLNARMDELTTTLKGQKIEIELTSVPRSWEVFQSEDILFFLVAATTISKQYVEPEPGKLMLNYSVKNNDIVTKSGTVTIPDWNKKVTNNISSTNRVIRDYLGYYRENMYSMTDKAIDNIIREIKQ